MEVRFHLLHVVELNNADFERVFDFVLLFLDLIGALVYFSLQVLSQLIKNFFGLDLCLSFLEIESLIIFDYKPVAGEHLLHGLLIEEVGSVLIFGLLRCLYLAHDFIDVGNLRQTRCVLLRSL